MLRKLAMQMATRLPMVFELARMSEVLGQHSAQAISRV
jgi:hypothetical protein